MVIANGQVTPTYLEEALLHYPAQRERFLPPRAVKGLFCYFPRLGIQLHFAINARIYIYLRRFISHFGNLRIRKGIENPACIFQLCTKLREKLEIHNPLGISV